MKVTYDPKTDSLCIRLREGTVVESDEDKPGVILDYDSDGNLLSLEILDASLHAENPKAVEFAVS